MFAETLAGIALCKSAFEAIKKGVNTAKDISELEVKVNVHNLPMVGSMVLWY